MGKAPTVEVERITPKMAKEMLAGNERNRNVRDPRVRTLARAMSNGDWLLNGETIKFNGNGTLLDGQHRLLAVIESGKTVPFMVVRGLPAIAQETVDTGAARTIADTLRLRGETNVNKLGAALRALWTYWQHGTMGSVGGGIAPTIQELVAVLDEHPQTRFAVARGDRIIKFVPNFNSSCIAALYLFGQVDYEEMEQFASALEQGEGLTKGDARLALRNQMLRVAAQEVRPRPFFYAAWTIKAWNKWRAGEEQMYAYRWKPNQGDRFPLVEGLDTEWSMANPLRFDLKVA